MNGFTGTGTQTYDAIVADIDSPAYVVTTAAGGERAGCLVGCGAEVGVVVRGVAALVDEQVAVAEALRLGSDQVRQRGRERQRRRSRRARHVPLLTHGDR